MIDANGNPITGDAQINITLVNVSDNNEIGIFPGAFAGTDTNGSAMPIIMSYGTAEYFFS